MKKVNWFVVLAGGAVGLAAVLLTALGNPVNMGFCIACFLRDIVGACGMHGAAGAPETSSSCGTCVRYLAEDALLCAMDEDVEAVYEKIGKEDYTLLMNAE